MSNWYVAYTKPRSEKKAAERLGNAGWEVYCPLKKEIKQWSDRKKKVETPFFTSYLFIKLENYEVQRVELLNDPALLNFVFWQRKPAVISDKEMQDVMDFFDKYEQQNIKADNITVGSSIELGEGPFAGKRGIVKNISAKKVTLVLEQLGIQLVVDLGEKLNKSSR
ncbi:MAG: transcription termination/antitermination protein NusG [Bacteroidia bacterium]